MSFAGGINEAQQGEKRRAELYMRVYKYAAEDFIAQPDFLKFQTDTQAWMNAVEQQLAMLMRIIASHTHNLVPHTHSIPPHFHMTKDGPTSPLPLETLPNIPIEGLIPNQQPQIVWRKLVLPVFKNTTGTIPNLIGNKAIMGISVKDDATDMKPHLRRKLVIPILQTPSIPPYMTQLATNR